MKKRHFIFIATAILLVSCTTEKYYDEVEQQEFKSLSFNKRSYAEALEIANDAISMLGDDAVTRGGFPRKIDERHGVKYITNTITRSGTPDTLLYIFNYEGEEGYAVVSANKNTDGLLAVTESGSYDPSIGTDNPGLAMFMDMAEDYVVSAKENDMSPTALPLLRYKTVETVLRNDVINPRISLRWGQSSIYGQYCQNGLSGCANTAMAMTMAYYGHPSSIMIDYEEDIVLGRMLNWDNIRNHISNNNCTCTEETHETIGKLCRQLGELSSSNYEALHETKTSPSNVYAVLSNFGYTLSSITEYSNGCVPTALSNNKLILMYGFYDTSTTGHIWIIDGCNYYLRKSQDYVSSNGIDWEEYGEATYVTREYNHINWGWDGYNNGYFNDGVFCTYNYVSLDTSYSSDYAYNFNNRLNYFTVYH